MPLCACKARPASRKAKCAQRQKAMHRLQRRRPANVSSLFPSTVHKTPRRGDNWQSGRAFGPNVALLRGLVMEAAT
ncbi:hypothetical protein SL003B_0727 [Polymorphum gilvum SL003B-26A1]|uniref:Uncharacterized protein n=1 Tax=Polymorphum gilvum (strain LMG 25793 / CGMCC 1.9160 / SL003B-26A1) TaxID=991905 RepID=F2IVQ0_POLGS|nr:hypothetical protein SL003B_0727 [Polymorphum gilvum SL003B-26A1]